MISVIGTTSNYILQPSLVEMHKKSMEWLSATLLWKRELKFFQQLLDSNAPKFGAAEDKKRIDHFQNLIIYYSGELVDEFNSKLRKHESNLAHMLQSKNESDTVYFKEHQGLMIELQSFSDTFRSYRYELFDFIEKVL